MRVRCGRSFDAAQSASSSDSSSSAVSSQVSHWLTCGGEGDTHTWSTVTLPQTIPCFESACGSVASLRYLEQSFSFSREFLGDVFFPCEEGFFFDDLHVVEVDKVAQQHALWKDKHLDVQVVVSFTSGSCF